MWYDNNVRVKPDKVVVKLRDDDGRFLQSVIVPTLKYPLNGAYRVFHQGNTRRAPEEMFPAIDRVKYRIGQCYSNTISLVEELKKDGFQAEPFVGWLFTEDGTTPFHHCWAVVDEDIVVDLSDDQSVFRSAGPDLAAMNREEIEETFIDFVRQTKSWPNSYRCYPMGTPFPSWYYVGSPCDPVYGVTIYQRLAKDYPDHEALQRAKPGELSSLQKKIKEKGLL